MALKLWNTDTFEARLLTTKGMLTRTKCIVRMNCALDVVPFQASLRRAVETARSRLPVEALGYRRAREFLAPTRGNTKLAASNE